MKRFRMTWTHLSWLRYELVFMFCACVCAHCDLLHTLDFCCVFFLAVGSGVLLYLFYFEFHLFSWFLAVLLIYWFELLPPMFQFLFFCSTLIKDFPFPSVTDGFFNHQGESQKAKWFPLNRKTSVDFNEDVGPFWDFSLICLVHLCPLTGFCAFFFWRNDVIL